ncbi:putative quinol monooxygenase [Dyella flagellata]|uniref:ABM domain-containing protein n=1 Tax=Dyella flagellata TaxID=1867833 RepID=A0ABQ5X711_9GAMM|nr:putative quinol monooxygenase [Dyella flagellata]GLQ86828.1 hypothetical protein GCM10007898_03940 [Dyella flagellata]
MQYPSQITLVAFLIAKPGEENELIRHFQPVIQATRREAGCIDYHLHQNAKVPTDFVMYENYVDQHALKAHQNAPYTQALLNYLNDSGASVQYDLWTMLTEHPNHHIAWC